MEREGEERVKERFEGRRGGAERREREGRRDGREEKERGSGGEESKRGGEEREICFVAYGWC